LNVSEAAALRHYWQRHTTGDGRWREGGEGPPGEELAALRRGVGKEPGTVPAMWRFYSTLDESGRVTAELAAEHLALTLFALHQRSLAEPVHRQGVGLGTAVANLRDSGRFSEEAVERRFVAAAMAESLGELGVHLRGLVSLLRALPQQGLDYNRLYRDLLDWQRPSRRAAVRRRWGGQFYASRRAGAPSGK